MATTRVNRTKPASAAPATPPEDDVPQFAVPAPAEVVYDGPVLFRIGEQEFRARRGRTFTASLAYLNAIRTGSIRSAELAAIEYLAGPAALTALLPVVDDADQWNRVTKRALDHLLGKFEEDMQGN